MSTNTAAWAGWVAWATWRTWTSNLAVLDRRSRRRRHRGPRRDWIIQPWTLDLGRLISRTFWICWHHRWLWVLGVFGGAAGGSFNYTSSSRSTRQVPEFVQQYLGLIIAVVAVVLVIILVAFLIGCIAVPASVWAAVMLDAGSPVRLGQAWRYGLTRFWAVLRLALLKLCIVLAVVAGTGVFVLLGVLLYAAVGPASLWGIIPLGILLLLAFLTVLIVVSLGLAWADRTLVLLDLGAVDSIRSSWWLFRHHKLDTFVFALVMGVIVFGVQLGVLVGTALCAIPGGLFLIAGIASGQAPIIAIGVVLVVLIAGAFLVVGAGFTGSLAQVSYAMACRDLCIRHNMSLAIEPLPAPTPA